MSESARYELFKLFLTGDAIFTFQASIFTFLKKSR